MFSVRDRQSVRSTINKAYQLISFIFNFEQDTAAIWRSWEETHRLSQLVAAGEYDDDKNGTDIRQKSNHLAHPHKFIATCPPESAMRQADFDFGKASKDLQAPFTMPQLPEGARGTFVGFDLNKYMDVCESPQYRHMHSGTSWTWPTPGPHCAIMTVRTILPSIGNSGYLPWEALLNETHGISHTGRRSRQLWRYTNHHTRAIRFEKSSQSALERKERFSSRMAWTNKWSSLDRRMAILVLSSGTSSSSITQEGRFALCTYCRPEQWRFSARN